MYSRPRNDPAQLPVAPQETAGPVHSDLEHLPMAIEVRIPTILRGYTGGAKSVEGSGDTLADLISDLETRHNGLRERLVDATGLRRFVNVYLNDEDVRFLGGMEAPVKDGDTVTVLPAVAGGAS
jgi:molybdopterin synthase sulfur carrier subunit